MGLMSLLSRVRIGTRLFALLGFLVILPAVIGGVGYIGLGIVDGHLEEMYRGELVPVQHLSSMSDELSAGMIQLYLGQKHDPGVPESDLHEKTHSVDRHTDAAQKHWNAALAEWESFKKENRNEDLKELITRMDGALAKFDRDGRSIVLEGLRARRYKALYEVAAYQIGQLYTETEKIHEELTEKLKKQAEADMAAADAVIAWINGLVIAAVISGVILSLGSGLVILRSITTPLNAMVQRVSDIAEGEGDLTRRLETSGKDELSELAGKLNQFIQKIHDNVVTIATTTREVTESASTLDESSVSLSSATEETSIQAGSISSAATELTQSMQVVSSSVEEMSVSIQEVARRAAEAARIAGEANEAAMDSSAAINDLGKGASEIGSVIESIVSIASQTNLLALNASIEAASAGEAGRGFAVVASEVKELARQASASSEEIKRKVGGMQTSTERTVAANGAISQIINQINEISSNIAAAVEEQSIAAREIANTIAQATVATKDVTKNTAGITEAAKGGAQDAARNLELARKLAALSDSLSKVVGQFKIKAS